MATNIQKYSSSEEEIINPDFSASNQNDPIRIIAMLTYTIKVKGFSCHHVLSTKMTLTDLASTDYRQRIATTQFLYLVLKKD